MAYTSLRKAEQSCNLPVEPTILPCYLSGTGDYVYSIPWDNCKLTGAQMTTTTAGGADETIEVDIEITAAGGTEIATATVASGTTAGTEDAFSFSSEATGNYLNDDAKINFEVAGSTTWVGFAHVYFERASVL